MLGKRERARRLACVLGIGKALAYLDLSYNRIGDEGVGRLAVALGECKAFVFLELSHNLATGLVMRGRGGWRGCSWRSENAGGGTGEVQGGGEAMGKKGCGE
eukprot:3938021-Rhodomonas_salina.2